MISSISAPGHPVLRYGLAPVIDLLADGKLQSAGRTIIVYLGTTCNRITAAFFTTLIFWFALAQLVPAQSRLPSRPVGNETSSSSEGYIGSRICANCHSQIYATYSQTSMGRSMSLVDASFLSRVPASASIFDSYLNRHFETYVRDGNLYQSEFETGNDGKEIFRNTQKIDWIIGSGANGFGAITRSGNYLFEAPLSFYSNINNWALSPGYESGDYGFSRPILPGCVSCHSGRPQPVLDGNGRFRDPPFWELTVSCENCHGPGAKHLAAIRNNFSPQNARNSIVNPAKLARWLADDICMRCHQTGQARVLHPGKDYRDFRPGTPLDGTLSIFLVPFGRESPPPDDLLQHYLFMRLSKCNRRSGGRLSCLTCHDPHVQPSEQEVPAYFREKCTSCHTQSSCKAALTARRHTNPPDNCIGCHMPKRDIKVISHSILTNHRIVTDPKEPFPEDAFHMASPELPDLVHLSAPPGKPQPPDSLILLEAYRQIMTTHPDYRQRYWWLAKQLQASAPDNISVLEALADASLQTKSWEGAAAAIRYFDLARSHGSINPVDFEMLGRLLSRSGQQPRAVDVLQDGIRLIPYDAELYRLLANLYASLNRVRESCEVLTNANRLFPQDSMFRASLKTCESAQPSDSQE